MMSSKRSTRKRKRCRKYYCGYEYEFVDTIDKRHICSLCNNVIHDAYLTGCCGRYFCASCLIPYLDERQDRMKQACPNPHCREIGSKCMQNKAIIREVNELEIYCTNETEGCEWAGVLGELKNHINSTDGCDYVKVACTNDGCKESMWRKFLQTHLQDKCYFRPYECEHCGHIDTYTTITGKTPKQAIHDDHYSECPDYPLPCPNRCGEIGIRRKAMPDHRITCPLELLDCEFKDVGCKERIARKDMPDHMTKNQQKHILQRFQGLQKFCQQMKQEQENIERGMSIFMQSTRDNTPLLVKLLQFNSQLMQELREQTERSQQELHLLKDDVRRGIDALEKSIKHNTSTLEATTKSLSYVKSLVQVGLYKIGDTLTFRVLDFPQLMQEKQMWCSPPFSIAGKVTVQLTMHPIDTRTQNLRVSVYISLEEVLKKESMWLTYDVSVATIGAYESDTFQTVKVCTCRDVNNATPWHDRCSSHIPFPSRGGKLQSELLFLDIEEANSQPPTKTMMLKLKLLEHEHTRGHNK